MPVPAAHHCLAAPKKASQNSGAEAGLPCQRRTRLKVVTDKIEGVLAFCISDRSEADRWIENLSGERRLPALFEIILRAHDSVGTAGQYRHHEFALVLDWRYGRAPREAISQGECRLETPCVLRIESGFVVPDGVLQVGSFGQELKAGVARAQNRCSVH